MSKEHRKGVKQQHGSSRKNYFAARKLYIAARNKARKIAKGATQK